MHFMTPEALADFKLKIDQDFSDTARFIYHPKEEHDVQPDYVPDDEED